MLIIIKKILEKSHSQHLIIANEKSVNIIIDEKICIILLADTFHPKRKTIEASIIIKIY